MAFRNCNIFARTFTHTQQQQQSGQAKVENEGSLITGSSKTLQNDALKVIISTDYCNLQDARLHI